MGIDENIYADNVFLIIEAVCKQSEQYPSWVSHPSSHNNVSSIVNPHSFSLTLDWLNLFQESWKYIYIFCHLSSLPCCRLSLSCFMADNHPFIPQNQYNSCWWSGDRRSQIIISNCIDLDLPEYPSFSTTGLIISPLVTFLLVAVKLPKMHQVTSLSATSVHNKQTVYTGYWRYGHIACIHTVGKKKLLSAAT